MKILYFDCFSGISGDMTLAALLDIGKKINNGIDENFLIGQLKTLQLDGWEIKVNTLNKNGIEANNVDVILTHSDETEHSHTHEHEDVHSHDLVYRREHTHKHCHHDGEHAHNHIDVEKQSHEHTHNRTFKDILEIIDKSEITPNAKDLSRKIFERLAIAEGKIHGQPVENVHFHEVGALDSIIDILGVAILIDALHIDKIYCSIVNDGHGFINCQHGLIPVPVPAVCEIFANCEKFKTKVIDVPTELVTPTGAAIVAELAEDFCLMPQMSMEAVGYGSGKKVLQIPNILRITYGELSENPSEIVVLETNIDDCTGEIMGYVMEKLLQRGALDVFFTNIMMKKNRPAIKLTVLCNQTSLNDMENVIFKETTTIGIRRRIETRTVLSRQTRNISTPYGNLKVKVVFHDGAEILSPEYESAKELAEKNEVPLRVIYDFVTKVI